jgi:ABC-2 type transport system permease protein
MSDVSAAVSQTTAQHMRVGYLGHVNASCGLALLTILRRPRLILATVIVMMPVMVPLLLAFLSKSAYAEQGNEVFVRLVERLQINSLAPLLGLFFASMLIGEDVEQQTLPYVLTRPIPRSAWVLGRYVAYLFISVAILSTSIFLTFAACTALAGIAFRQPDLLLLAQYLGVGVVALAAYGAVMMLLGAATKRPIVYGVLLLYGWQRLALIVPGLVDFLTIEKYTNAMLPALATQVGMQVAVQSILGEYNKQVFAVSALTAGATLAGVTLFCLAASVYVVRHREYAAWRAAGG